MGTIPGFNERVAKMMIGGISVSVGYYVSIYMTCMYVIVYLYARFMQYTWEHIYIRDSVLKRVACNIDWKGCKYIA
jgi:DNA repair photolyase